MKTANDLIEEAACMCDLEADRQSAYEGSVRDRRLKATYAATAYVLMAVAQRIRDLKADYKPSCMTMTAVAKVMHDEIFQAALQDYHHNGGSSAAVACAALKAIVE